MITAIPVAAAAPASIAVGRHQNCDSVVITPTVATVSPAMASVVSPCAPTATSQPSAPTSPGTARCQRRSRDASERRLTSTMATAPQPYGSTVSRPMASGLATPAPLISVGSQKPTP